MRFLSEKNETDTNLALAAMAAFPDLEEAQAFLLEAHDLTVSTSKLDTFRRVHAEAYEEVRRQIAPRLEDHLTGNLLDTANLAAEAMHVAVERTKERLDANVITDPSRTARDLADVIAKAVDKKLALEGRPTRVVEHRDINEIIRALEAKGVLQTTIEGTARDA